MRFFYLEVKKIENLGFWGGKFSRWLDQAAKNLPSPGQKYLKSRSGKMIN